MEVKDALLKDCQVLKGDLHLKAGSSNHKLVWFGPWQWDKFQIKMEEKNENFFKAV